MKLVSTFFLSLLYAASLASPSLADESSNHLAEARNKIMRFTDQGVTPAELHIRSDDNIVFYFNDTKESLTTLEVDYGKKATHCSTKNLKINADGSIVSTEPFGPKEFATTCFHEPGTYALSVYGLKSRPQGISGKIIVE